MRNCNMDKRTNSELHFKTIYQKKNKIKKNKTIYQNTSTE